MAYRPQANGTAESMVQTLTRDIKLYLQTSIKRIGLNTLKIDVCDQYGTRSRTRRYSVLPDPRLGSEVDVGGDFTIEKYQDT